MTNAIPKCPKCGSEKLPIWGEEPVRYSCPLDSKDCRIKELERQLKELDGSWKLAWAGLLSERDSALKARDEALDQVVVLRWHLGMIQKNALSAEENPMRNWLCTETQAALSNTSALAAQRKREIQREAVEAVLPARRSGEAYDLRSDGYQKGWNDCLDAINAAILGTTENSND